MQRIDLSWSVGPVDRVDAKVEKRVPATVPGAVQLDWARAQGWPAHFIGNEFRRYAVLEDCYWSYLATAKVPPLGEGERLVLILRGVDYSFTVRVDSQTLHEQEGMFTPVELDITDHARHGSLHIEVIVHPAPKSCPWPADRNQANQSCKPAVSYGWDFHPRLIPLGLWDEAYLEVPSAVRISRLRMDTKLSDDFRNAMLCAAVTLEGDNRHTHLRWLLHAPTGEVVASEEKVAGADMLTTFDTTLESPRLWWPHDQGEPALYTVQVELVAGGEVLDRNERRIGLRRVRLVMNEGAWSKPTGFPKTRSTPPITLEINGRPIFARGSNWVAPDIFYGTLTADRLHEQLNLARVANMNMLRCWGGAPVMKNAFFDLCDELGIMIWQEFPLACNRYEGIPQYLATLDRESKSIITRLREHPSVVLWCGGNELFNSWSKMTDQDAALRLLNRNTFDLDPDRPFLMTSPIMGMGHGHYSFRDPDSGEEAWHIFQRASCTAYTEFGCPGPSHVAVLDTFLPPEERFPPRPGTTWDTHHATGAWQKNSWLNLPDIEHYFGSCESLEQLVENGQLLQAEGCRGLFEEARRQKPTASMALNWCLNEPWPRAANNSLIAWPCVPKPALYAVGEACRPALASARIRQFLWREGDLFDPELWILSDMPRPLAPGRLLASLRAGDCEIPLLTWDFPELSPNRHLRGPRAQITLPHFNTKLMQLVLRVVGRPELDSTYRLVYRSAPKPSTHVGAAALNQ